MSKIPQPLFIFEMANNHMGSVEHGLRIIREFKAVAQDFPFTFAFKFQYRDLDTYIHPDYQQRMDIKYVKRFAETRLTEDDFRRLLDGVKQHGFTAICTPFDEVSVDRVVNHGFDILKIASCSLTDWPLLEKIAGSNLPIIASTAGSALEQIDSAVSFLQHRNKDFAILHCVAEYPTQDAGLQLNQLDLLRQRYPGVPVGYSTHELPDNTTSVQLALAKGAGVFEKHVGVGTAEWPLNNYSATPAQVQRWLQAAASALAMLGGREGRYQPSTVETDSLNSLRRGVFLKQAVAAGERVDPAKVFFAFPPEPGQWLANDWSKYNEAAATADIAAKGALTRANTTLCDTRQQVRAIAEQVKTLLSAGHIVVPASAELELSHHYGLPRFAEFGLTMITVVNREYCKKLLILLPGQKHPEQYHQQKEETFHVLHGEAELELDGVLSVVRPGDVVTVPRGVHHAFSTKAGAVFEEISSTHFKDDSYYVDPAIMANKNRKTWIKYWLN